jgi:hypothetical protein
MDTRGAAAFRLLVLVGGVALFAATTVAPASEPGSTPEKTTYAIARKSGLPYRCSYSVASFLGERDKFTADIQGDDFIAFQIPKKPDPDDTDLPPLPVGSLDRVARKGAVGYRWPCIPQDRPAPGVEGCRFDLTRIKAETGMTSIPLFFSAPADDASCERIASANIAIPPLKFGDMSQLVIKAAREELDQSLAALKTLDFTVLLPSVLPSEWSIRNLEAGEGRASRGSADLPDFNDQLHLEYKSAAHEQILVYQQKAPATFNPPSDCAGFLARYDERRRLRCRLLFTTKRKHSVYVQDLTADGHAARYAYITVIDGTAVSVSAFDELSIDELGAFFDSLRTYSTREIAMRVGID